MQSNFTPTTKRLIVGSLGAIGLVTTLGWIFFDVNAQEASLIIVSITTGFFSLLKGSE